MPSHTHNTLSGRGSNASLGDDGWFMGATIRGTDNSKTKTESSGSGQSHNNIQPSLALNYVIKT